MPGSCGRSSSGVCGSPLIRDLPALEGTPPPARVDLEPALSVDADGVALGTVDRDPPSTQEVARSEEVVERIEAGVGPRLVAGLHPLEQRGQDRRAFPRD